MSQRRDEVASNAKQQDANGATEVDPFIKRVVTVKPGDVVIYKYLGRLTRELVDDLTAQLEKKMGEISFVVIDDLIDITVLKQSAKSDPIHLA